MKTNMGNSKGIKKSKSVRIKSLDASREDALILHKASLRTRFKITLGRSREFNSTFMELAAFGLVGKERLHGYSFYQLEPSSNVPNR